MNAGQWFGRVAAWAAGHSRAILAVGVVLALAAGIGATRIPTDAAVGTLSDTDTATYRATQQVRDAFGEEPVVVLARGDLQGLILGPNLFQLLRLEGCLSGNVPKGAKPIPGPCAELARLDPVEFVSGPGTFLNEAVGQIDRQLRRLSERVPPERFREFLLSVATRYGITSLPTLDNPDFVATVVFDLSRARGTPKARLSYLFPNSRSAQIVVRLKPDLSEAERHRAIGLIEAAASETTPRRACAVEKGKPAPCFELDGGSYLVSGAPVVIDGVARALKDALLVLFAVSLGVMALTLLLVFRSRLRLLPLALALAAAALAFGLFGLFGGSLTMASIAALPILIGLAVDYAIQFQARFDEAIDEGAEGIDAARTAATAGGPTIGAACLPTAAGFLALQLSPIPMVRTFGLLLILGVVIAFLLALTAGFAALRLRSSGGWRGGGGPPRRAGREAPEHRGGNPPDRTRPPEDLGPLAWARDWTLWVALEHPLRVLGVGLALALIGWGVGTQIETASDIRSLAPQNISAVKNLNQLQETTGVSGELDVSVESPDLTDPATIEWMAAFKQRVLRSNGFSGENPSCLEAEICPGPALSDFLTRGGELTQRGIDATLAALSPYALRQVAPIDPETGEVGQQALLSFGIRAQSLEDQQALVDRVRSEIGEPGAPGGPPTGVEVQLAGLPVIAAESAGDLSSSRYWLTLAGLLAVALALFAVYRSPRRALVPLVPTVLATGWASLIIWLTGIPLNPMSAALGALTIAIATEFGVILAGRFHEERRKGSDAEQALRSAYGRTGAAVLASGVTAIAGFAVLVASDIQMLRDFGFVTVIDLTVALLGVMVILPAALSWSGER
ncbi:MAG TPA: MMPL family transporter [Solirubrobacterales bacterium]|nr:MMPL family transporter [Solirubrobacterales bacterium]